MDVEEAAQLRADAHFEQALPENIGQGAEHGGGGGGAGGEIDDHRDILMEEHGAALGDLGFDIAEETGRRQG